MRGDIFSADLSPVVGSEQGGIRPVGIIQNDTGNRHSPTVIAAAITTAKDKANLPTHVTLSGDQNPLYENSIVLLEQIRTIDKKRLLHYFGRLSYGTIKRIDEALAISIGFKNKRKPPEFMLMTLCPDCLQTYRNVYKKIYRHKGQKHKDSCTICQTGWGFDYDVYS